MKLAPRKQSQILEQRDVTDLRKVVPRRVESNAVTGGDNIYNALIRAWNSAMQR